MVLRPAGEPERMAGMKKWTTNIVIYGFAAAIIILICTGHDRLGLALLCVALVPTSYAWYRTIKDMNDD
jgi:hypothetical protein